MNAEQAKAIKAGEDWSLVCQEIDAWIDGQLKKLAKCEPEELRHIQAKIAAFEEVKNLPQVVIDRED